MRRRRYGACVERVLINLEIDAQQSIFPCQRLGASHNKEPFSVSYVRIRQYTVF